MIAKAHVPHKVLIFCVQEHLFVWLEFNSVSKLYVHTRSHN